MANQRFSRKIFNICILAVIIVIIIFIALMFALHYDVNGETNMPFQISKISVISTVDGQDVENSDNKWDINVIQNNDIYLYIEKNEGYSKQEIIDSVKIDNFIVKQLPTIGEIKIYKPSVNDMALFQNSEENIIESVVFNGATSTDTRNLEISNQGGVISFRCANNNVGNYISNDDEEINYDNLLNKLNITEDAIATKISFNVTINLNSGKAFKAENIELQLPNSGIIDNGTTGKEYTDLQEIVFKRIEN
jgi:hypothetical protein